MKGWTTLLLAGVAAAVLAVFSIVLKFDFVMFDDDINIVFNRHLGTLDREAWRWLWSDISYMHRYLPLGWVAFFAVFAIGGLDPAWYHGANLLIHTANAGLVFVACRQFLTFQLGGRVASTLAPREISAVTALAAVGWGCHPMRAESVGWASGLLYLLSAFPAVLAWLAFHHAEVTARLRWHAAGVAAYAMSALVYPIALGLPALMLAWLYACRSIGRRVSDWRVVVPYGMVSAMTLAAAVYARLTEGSSQIASSPSLTLVAERIGQVAYVWIYYLWRPFWPAALGPAYDTLVPGGMSLLAVMTSAVMCVLSTWAAVRFRRSVPWLLPVWIGYLVCMLPHAGLLERPFFTADRYFYFIGIWGAMLLSLAVCHAMAIFRTRAVLAGALACCAALGLQAHRQVTIWHDTRTLFQRIDELTSAPLMRAAYLMRYGSLLAAFGAHAEGHEIERRARKLQPNIEVFGPRIVPPELRNMSATLGVPLYAIHHHAIALEHVRAKDVKGAQAHFARGLRLAPNYTEARFNRAVSRIQWNDTNGALADFFALDASAIPAEKRRGFWFMLSEAFRAEGKPRLADAAEKRARAE